MSNSGTVTAYKCHEATAVCVCASGRPGDDDADEDDDRLNADMTAALHFGGGFIRKDTPTVAPTGDGDEQGDPGRRRSKKEACSPLSCFRLHVPMSADCCRAGAAAPAKQAKAVPPVSTWL